MESVRLGVLFGPVGGTWGIGRMLLSVGMTLFDPLQTIRLGFVTEGDRVRWAVADSRAHFILEFRRHLADPHDGVAVVVQFEHFGAETQAGAETCA